jgi:glycerol dehydrogenase-like iron-containing ADH family enzyme
MWIDAVRERHCSSVRVSQERFGSQPMQKPKGSWSRTTDDPKSAVDQDIRYGHGLLSQESAEWPPYFVVASPTAFKAARKYLTREPEAYEHVRWLDWNHLQEITDRVPDGVELIVGIGGGIALDASKYVALKTGLPLVLVPTIVSTGAIIHSMFAKWDGHKIVGPSTSWPWLDFDHAVVDYDLVLGAPYYLNTAGLGDVLCGYAAIAEWRRNSRMGVSPPFDSAAVAKTAQHHRDVVMGFPRTLGAEGELTPDSVRFILTAIQERDDKGLIHPAAPAADHLFWLGAEEINEKGWIHGEFVALSAVVIAWHCEESPEMLLEWLDTCKVRRLPSEIGLSRGELLRACEYAPAYLSDEANGRDVPSIVRLEPIAGARFDALWEFLETA